MVGKKCVDSGIIDRLLFVYWYMEGRYLELPDFETVKSLEDYIIWLRATVRADPPGKWPHPQQVRYNYHLLVIALAQYCRWLDD